MKRSIQTAAFDLGWEPGDEPIATESDTPCRLLQNHAIQPRLISFAVLKDGAGCRTE